MSSPPNPFEGLEELFQTMSRQFEQATRQWESGLDQEGRFDVSLGEPATGIDLADHDDEFVVTVDVPGYERDDLEVRLIGDQLVVSGQRTDEHEREAETYLRRERRTDSISRRIQLPEPVDADDVSASVNNGVLTVTLPKRAGSGTGHSIEIE